MKLFGLCVHVFGMIFIFPMPVGYSIEAQVLSVNTIPSGKHLKWSHPNASACWNVGLLLVYVKIVIDTVFEKETLYSIELASIKSAGYGCDIFYNTINYTGKLLCVYCEYFAENVRHVAVTCLLHLHFVLFDRTEKKKREIKSFKQEFK